MTVKRNLSQRVLSFLLSAVLLLSLFPWNSINLHVAAEDGLARYADPSTLNSWKDYFFRSINDFDTANAGGIITDKTVLTSADELKAMGVTGISDPSDRGFLGVLSAIGSNMTVTGESAVATDTVMLLDTSGSMKRAAVEAMLEAANISIKTLLDANPNNRVAVVFFANTTVTFLPLDRYTTDKDGIYMYRTTGGSIRLDENVLDSNGNQPDVADRSVTGGTYMSRGLHQVLSVFKNTTLNQTVPRKPVVMFMTDGSPTRSDTRFTNPPVSGSNNLGDGEDTDARIVFATELAASYVKETISRQYVNAYGETGNCLFYTLGMTGGDTSSLRECVLDPVNENNTTIQGLWQKYRDADYGEQVRIYNYSNVSVTKLQEGDVALSENYVDSYFAAATEADLVDAFKKVLADISLHTIYYPTLVEGDDSNHSGYISFVDKMGRYMDAIAIQGLIIDNTLYNGSNMAQAFMSGALGTVQAPTNLGDNLIWSIKERLNIDADTARSLVSSAYTAGQLYYNSDTDFSNYFGWYSDANNNFLGFYAEGTTVPAGAVYTNKSYLFLGEYDSVAKTYDSQMMYATIRIREEIATGEDEVDFAIPASLVPTITYQVDLDVNGNPKDISVNATSVSPIRLVYETELDSRINKWTAGEIVDDSYTGYLSAGGNSYTMNEDGSINFYNNKWSFDNLVGYGTLNTYSYYRPSYENNRHYYQEDVIFYVADGNSYKLYEGSKPVVGDGNSYYYGATVYRKTGEKSFEKETVFEQLSDSIVTNVQRNSNGNWYVPAQYVRFAFAGYSAAKAQNSTATMNFYASPYSDYTLDKPQAGMEGHSSIVGTTLGNNGKIVFEAETGIRITKQVDEAVNSGDKQFSFTVTNTALKSTNCEAYKLDTNSNGTETTISFNGQGVATVNLKAGESIYIGDMAKGQRVTIKELGDIDYIVKNLTVDGISDDDFIAEVILDSVDMPHAVFTNGAREKGSITVSKRVTHPYTNYTVPEDKAFPVTLTFTLDGVPLSNYALAGGHVTNASGELSVSLTHNSSMLFDGIPVDTVVQVTEAAPAGFSPTYTENIGTVNDGIVTVSTIPVTVAIVNDYNPSSVSGASIKVSGIKRFDQNGYVRPWTAGDSFTFLLQEYKNDWVTMEHQNAIQTITIQTGDSYEGTTKDYPFNFTDVFQTVTYTAPGTYYYRVVEQAGSIPGVNYDITTHRFEVTVSDDNMEGALQITKVVTQETTVSVTGSYDVTATFVNDYNPNDAVANLEIHKVVSNPVGSSLAALDGFQFLLAEVNDFNDTVDWNTAVSMGTTTSTGVIKFPITLDAPGIYKYKVKEFIPAEVPAGWTYTETVQDIIVEVTDSYGSAGLVAKAYVAGTENSADAISTVIVAFENVYSPAAAEMQIDFINKILTGRDLVAGEFTFTVYSDDTGAVYTTGANTAATAGQASVIVFENNLSFDKVGEYHFSVLENNTNNPSVTFDREIYHFTVVVSDNGLGFLTAVMTVDDGHDNTNTITFTNNYDAQDIPYSFTGMKELTGKTLTANAFGFFIQECNENGTPLTNTQATLVYNDEHGAINFPVVTYTYAGIYHYLIWENIPSGDTMGISYDESRYIATVAVTDNFATGKLEATVSYEKQSPGESTWIQAKDGILFGNSYTAASTSVAFVGTKTVNGMDLTENAYSFELYKSDAAWNLGTLLDTQKNGAPNEYNIGSFTFDSQIFSHTGVYHFIAKEVIGNAKGVAYDGTVYCITVNVTDNGRGQLLANTVIETSTGIPSDTLEFVNEYAPVEGTSVTVLGEKTLETGDGTDVDFTDFTFSFELYESDESFTVSGTPETADSAANGKYSFTMDYTPDDLGNTFHYVIVETNYGVGGMTYSTEEYHITVSVLDTIKDGVIETAVEITDKSGNPVDSDKIDFINNYAITEPARFDVSGTKVLTGRDIKLNEFRFDLYPQGSSDAISSAFCGTDGQFTFLNINVNRAGVHAFIVREDTTSAIPGITYDATEYLVTVTVADNKDGTLKVTDIRYERIDSAGNVEVDAPIFNNSYSARATAPLSLTANKVLTGRDMTANEFVFVIYDEDNKSVYTTGTNKAATAGHAAMITFQKDFVFDQIGEYHFSVYEQTTSVPGVTSDVSKFYFTIVVTDDGNGVLKAALTVDGRTNGDNTVSFTNSYEAQDASKTLTGLKVLEGQVLTANAFSFYIQPCDVDGNVNGQAQLVHNGENGTITFPEITYTDAGTYHYLVWENIPTGELFGVTYDETKYIATVKVTDNTASGKLVTDVTYQIQLPGETTWTNTDSGIIFGNRYDASGTFVILEGTKTVTGMALAANDYSFELYKSNETWTLGELLDTKANGAADESNTATFSFEKESYDAECKAYYIVKEKLPAEQKNGVIYDETVYHITVTITDNDRGLLVPEITVTTADGTPAESIHFVNRYAPVEGTSVTVLGEKTLEKGDGTDVDFTDFTFSFELHTTDETFAVTETPEIADSTADGKYSFTKVYVPEDLNKSFYYVIIEKDYGVGGMTYSEAEYHITVQVLDTVKDGILETVVTITDQDGNPVDSDKINFVNNYAITEAAKFDISGTKELSGRGIQADEFKFDLYTVNALMEIGTEPMSSVFCGTDGTFNFEDISLNTAGSHYFILKEDGSAEIARPGVTYDDTEYLITVTVTDNKNGTLSVTDIKYERIDETDNVVVDTPVFSNNYRPSATFPLYLSGNKVLNGRELAAGEFAFILQATDSQFNILDSASPVRVFNNENGFFTFDGIIYHYAGTYYYVISEDTSLDINRITFDEAKYYVTVRVTDDTANGKLVANYSIKTAPDGDTNVDTITFTNVYTPRPDDITVDLNITKTVVNLGSASMTPEGFQFALELLGTENKITVTSDANGKAVFTLSFTEDDIGNTYSFKLTEINTGADHVTYSTVEYLIDITISLDENNKLVATIFQDTVEVEAVTAEFVNEYDYTPVPPDGPVTGDSSNIILWFAILTLSAGAILSLTLFGKKETMTP